MPKRVYVYDRYQSLSALESEHYYAVTAFSSDDPYPMPLSAATNLHPKLTLKGNRNLIVLLNLHFLHHAIATIPP